MFFVSRLLGSAQENVQLAALSHSHVSQPLAASSKGAPQARRETVIINIIPLFIHLFSEELY